MANSKLDIFRAPITPEKNAMIDNIEAFLGTKSKLVLTRNDFQYQKIALELDVVIPADQSKVGDRVGNYARITQDNKNFYYFIMSAEWASQGSVRLHLSLDTLNTYQEDIYKNITSKTTIIREHRDRYKRANSNEGHNQVSRDPGTKTLIRKIDKEPENLILPKKKESDETIRDNSDLDMNWYLIYKTRDDLTPNNISNPVQCSLVADKKLQVGYTSGIPAFSLWPNDLGTGTYYYVLMDENKNCNIQFSNLKTVLTDMVEWNSSITYGDLFSIRNSAPKPLASKIKSIVFYKGGDGKVHVECDGDPVQAVSVSKTTTPFEFTCDYIFFGNVGQIRYSKIKYGYESVPLIPTINYYQGSGTANTLSIDEIDKTDSKLMKIIRLPYAPIEITRDDNGLYHFPANWYFKDGMIVLDSTSLNYNFEKNISAISLKSYVQTTKDIQPNTIHAYYNESKLYNSEFFTLKAVYDSFAKEIKLENVNPVSDLHDQPVDLNVYFKPTNTINSNFLFKFASDSNFYIDEETDYEPYLVVNRNNEESIFNNNYINYINGGYNYDKKAKTLSLQQSILNTAIGVGQTAITWGANKASIKNTGANFVENWLVDNQINNNGKTSLDQLSAVMAKGQYLQKQAKGSPFLSAAAISSGAGLANSIVNTVYGQLQAQNNIDKKLQELSMQATEVSGADDIDLLQYYGKNKLHKLTYSIDKLPKENIAELFHYTGYSHPTQEKPDFTSRYWFNYVQCNPDILDDLEQYKPSAYNNYLEDIKYRFNQGVTVYHYHPEIGVGWDMEQTYENWENEVLDTSKAPRYKYNSLDISEAIIQRNTILGKQRPILRLRLRNMAELPYTKFDVIWQDTNGNTKHSYSKNGSFEINLFETFGISWEEGTPIKVKKINIYNDKLSQDHYEQITYTIN